MVTVTGPEKASVMEKIYEKLVVLGKTVWHDQEWVMSLLPVEAIALLRKQDQMTWILDSAAAANIHP